MISELGFRSIVRLLIKESEVVRLRASRGSGAGHPIAQKPDRPNLGTPGKYEKDDYWENVRKMCNFDIYFVVLRGGCRNRQKMNIFSFKFTSEKK